MKKKKNQKATPHRVRTLNQVLQGSFSQRKANQKVLR